MTTPTLDTLNQWKYSLPDDQRELFSKVISQYGSELDFLENLEQMTNAQNAISGFTYHSETCPFAEQNKELIFKTLSIECIENFSSYEDSMQSWKCLEHIKEPLLVLLVGKSHPDYDAVLNALACFSLETCANSLINFIECNPNN